jgi:hypothetical protein
MAGLLFPAPWLLMDGETQIFCGSCLTIGERDSRIKIDITFLVVKI